jgi:hypothetical protein
MLDVLCSGGHMTAATRNELLPLQNIPFHMTVDGVTVVGEILWLSPNDIEVEIKEPFSGFKTWLHVPHFAMYEVNWLATYQGRQTTAITDRGRQRAEWLLRCLYDHARGKPAGWGVYELTPTGWTRVEEQE